MPCRAATPTRWLRHYLCETLRHNGEKMPVDDLIEFTSKRGIHNVDELYGRILPCVPLPLRRWRAPRGLRFAWGHQASRTWPTLPGVAHAQSSGTRRMRDRHTHRFTPKLEPAPDRWPGWLGATACARARGPCRFEGCELTTHERVDFALNDEPKLESVVSPSHSELLALFYRHNMTLGE